jgi:hypothetical protein
VLPHRITLPGRSLRVLGPVAAVIFGSVFFVSTQRTHHLTLVICEVLLFAGALVAAWRVATAWVELRDDEIVLRCFAPAQHFPRRSIRGAELNSVAGYGGAADLVQLVFVAGNRLTVCRAVNPVRRPRRWADPATALADEITRWAQTP